MVGGQPVERDRPGRGHRRRLTPPRVLGEHTVGRLGQQPQIRRRVEYALTEQRTGLFHRQRQVPERVRDPVRILLGHFRGQTPNRAIDSSRANVFTPTGLRLAATAGCGR